jgi:hypothetical protein
MRAARPPRIVLRQCDRLKGTDDVVRTLRGEEAFVISRAQIPVIALVIFVAIKSPDTAHDDERADPIVPKIADVMEAQIGSRIGAAEADVIVNDQLRKPAQVARFWLFLARGRGMVAQGPKLPFCVDDAAVGGRKICFRYLSYKQREFGLIDQRRIGLSSPEI